MIVWVTVALVIVLLVLVFTPVRLTVDVDTERVPGRQVVHVSGRWLILRWDGEERARVPRPTRRDRSTTRPARTRGDNKRRRRSELILAGLRSPGFVRRTRQLFGDVLRAIAPEHIVGWLRVGLADPADTGVLFGTMQGAAVHLACHFPDVRIEADYSGPVFAGALRANWRVRPASVLSPVVAFALSPTTWRALIAMATRERHP